VAADFIRQAVTRTATPTGSGRFSPEVAALPILRYLSPVNPHDHPTALKDLQDSIYREKVLRARRMTSEERLDSIWELSDMQFGLMLAGALDRIGSSDQDTGWAEVRRGIERLSRARDHRFYTRNPSAA
jgi:hypothetical protein